MHVEVFEMNKKKRTSRTEDCLTLVVCDLGEVGELHGDAQDVGQIEQLLARSHRHRVWRRRRRRRWFGARFVDGLCRGWGSCQDSNHAQS